MKQQFRKVKEFFSRVRSNTPVEVERSIADDTGQLLHDAIRKTVRTQTASARRKRLRKITQLARRKNRN